MLSPCCGDVNHSRVFEIPQSTSHPVRWYLKNKKLSYRRETARQLRTSFSAHSVIAYFTDHRISCTTVDKVVSTVSANKPSPYTLCLNKKGPPTLSIVTLRRINGFWRFLAQLFLTQLSIKWFFKFPPHPTSVSTLPGEIRTLLQVRYYILYKALLSLY